MLADLKIWCVVSRLDEIALVVDLEQPRGFIAHLTAQNTRYRKETSDIAARARKARDEAAAKRIGHKRENDGDAAAGGVIGEYATARISFRL